MKAAISNAFVSMTFRIVKEVFLVEMLHGLQRLCNTEHGNREIVIEDCATGT
jgi:hypothetical protein